MDTKFKFMKSTGKYLMSLFALLAVSCSDDDKTIDGLFETVERGAVLRTVSVMGGALDVLDTAAVTTIEVEEQDVENGGLLSEVRVFVDLTDNTPGATTTTSEAQLATIAVSEFSAGPFGLPRATFSATLGEMASALGISAGEYNCGDSFVIRLELVLSDGRSFTNTDVTGTVQGGSFFSSPFQYTINLIAPLPSDDLYTGDYQLTNVTLGNLGVGDYTDGTFTVESINNTTKVMRNIPTLGGAFGPVDFEFQFVCGEIIVTPGQGLGAGCGGTIMSGPAEVNATYDLENPDDSNFLINYTSDETGNCASPGQATIRLTKV